MSKQKMITVRINEDVYEQFKLWTEKNNSNVSNTLRDYILSCISPNQSIHLSSQKIDNSLEDKVNDLELSIKKLEGELYDKLYTNLYDNLYSQKIDNSIDNPEVKPEVNTKVNTPEANTKVNIKVNTPEVKPNLSHDEDEQGNISNEDVRGKIERLIIESGIKEGALENENKDKLSELCTKLLGRKVSTTNLSRLARSEKGFIAPAEFWEYFSAENLGNKWLWTRIK